MVRPFSLIVQVRFACIMALAAVSPGQSGHVDGSTDSGLWPRLIVAVQPRPDQDGGGSAGLRVRLLLADGTVLEGIPQGCPDIPQEDCSFSFFTSPRDSVVTLLVEARALPAQALSVRIPLGLFSYRGCRMTHVTVGFGIGGLQVGAPRLIDGAACHPSP